MKHFYEIFTDELMAFNPLADDYSSFYLLLDQTTPQTCIGTFNFPAVVLGSGTMLSGSVLTINKDDGSIACKSVLTNRSCFIDIRDSDEGTRGLIGVDGLGFTGVVDQFVIGTWTNSPLKFFTNQIERGGFANSGEFSVTKQIQSSLATGTSPFSITSTTVNTNLNADLLDGYHASSFLLDTGDTGTGNYTFNGNIVLNETGLDYDFRVEGVGQANALFVQGSDGYVGVGTNTPTHQLEVKGTADTRVSVLSSGTTTGVAGFELLDESKVFKGGIFINNNGKNNVDIYDGTAKRLRLNNSSAQKEAVFNEDGNDYDVRIEGDTDTTLLVCDAGLDQVQLGNTLIKSGKNITLRDSALIIGSNDDGHIDITADVSVDINSTLVTTNGRIGKITTITDTYTLLSTDETVVCNKSTPFTVTLPTVVVGQIFEIKSIGTGIVTVDGAGTDTIDGITTQNIAQWENLKIKGNAANSWIIL